MGTVSNSVIVLLLGGVTYGIVLTMLAYVLFWKFYLAHFKPFFFGMVTYFTFTFIIASIINSLLLSFVDLSALGSTFIFIYLFFIQAVSAIITECGKLFTIRAIKKSSEESRYALRGDAFNFGAGFGGLELILSVGVTMASYYSYAVILANGQAETVLASMSEKAYESAYAIFVQVAGFTSMDVISMLLQGFAMFIFQIGSSLLVHRAVYGTGKDEMAYFRLAVLFHLMMIFPGCVVSAGIVETSWFETILTLVFGAGVLYYGFDKIREFERQYLQDRIKHNQGKKTIHLK